MYQCAETDLAWSDVGILPQIADSVSAIAVGTKFTNTQHNAQEWKSAVCSFSSHESVNQRFGPKGQHTSLPSSPCTTLGGGGGWVVVAYQWRGWHVPGGGGWLLSLITWWPTERGSIYGWGGGGKLKVSSLVKHQRQRSNEYVCTDVAWSDGIPPEVALHRNAILFTV